MGSLVVQKRFDNRPKSVVTIIPAQSDQSVAVGTKSGPWEPSEGVYIKIPMVKIPMIMIPTELVF